VTEAAQCVLISFFSLPLVCYYDGISKQEGQLCTWSLCPHTHTHAHRIVTKILLFSVGRALQNATRNNINDYVISSFLDSKGFGDGISYNTDPVTEMLCSLIFRTPDDGQSPKTQQF
jgi:hypothetical protein